MTSTTLPHRPIYPLAALLGSFLLAAGCAKAPESVPAGLVPLKIEGEVEVNGKRVAVAGNGTYDSLTGAYEFDNGISESSLHRRDKLLLSLIPRSGLVFLGVADRASLLDQGRGGIEVNLSGHRKVDEVSRLRARLLVHSDSDGVVISYEGRITTPTDAGRPFEPDGEAVIRLGVNPENGTFVGGARINYDVSQPDRAGLGTADFWNLQGEFQGARSGISSAFAHVDRCGGNPDEGLAKGIILDFDASTVFEPGIITLSGVAKRDGVIHQYLGIANQTGGGETLFTFPVRIDKGMTATEVAGLIAKGFNDARADNEMARHILAVQGGDGVSRIKPDSSSARVAVTLSVDGTSIARADDPNATRLLAQVAAQAFSDQAVVSSENTGIRNQFGTLGEPPLTGWLTPFKVVFETPERAAGGSVSVLLNWTENVKGRGGLEGSQTDFADLVIPTEDGEGAEAIVERLTRRLAERKTQWGTHAFTQRDGNTLYIDAGIDFPHSVSLASDDAGVGYMSAAADLPFFK